MYKLDFSNYLIEYYGIMDNEFQLMSKREKSEIRAEYNKYLGDTDTGQE